jgi:murein L,D-transpeptidase YcbB/YkuD
MGRFFRLASCTLVALVLSANAFAQSDEKKAPAPDAAAPPASAGSVPASMMPVAPEAGRSGVARKTPRDMSALSAEDAAVADNLRELIDNRLARLVPRKADRDGIASFYRERGFAPLWTAKGTVLPRTRDAIEFLQGVAADGLEPADYPTPSFANRSPDVLAADELELSKSIVTFARYDDELVAAVERFQQQSNLSPDGVVGAVTVARLNSGAAPDTGKVETIIANMERWRWLPRNLGTTYVMVNVPDFTLEVVNRAATAWSTKIVVGKPGRYATPLFSETMKFITVNPTWNVPPSIIRNEYLPSLQRDPYALARIGLRIGRNADGSLRIYQPPGERNALGRLRFNFPNRFLVYQHDTPDKHLFAKQARAYSHGCMRVENPEQYAEILLGIDKPDQRYTAGRIRSLYGSGERTIRFDNPIPVYVTYQTAFVDNTGRLQLRPDIYGHDKEIANLLDNERQIADLPGVRRHSAGDRQATVSAPGRRGRSHFRSAFNDDREIFRRAWDIPNYSGGYRRRSGFSIW